MKTVTPYQREYQALKSKIDKRLASVCFSGSFILKNEVESFEKEFSRYLEVKHVIGVGNGMEALQIGLMAKGIGKGDEIITTSLSAVATTLSITSLGAIPVFVDIDTYFHIDSSLIEKAITKKTKAILPVHLYGQSVDMDRLRMIAKKHKLFLFEDACQAHGAMYRKEKLGTIGEFGAFSFYPTKNLGCYGDGGAIATNDDKVAKQCRILRNYGQQDRYVHVKCGLNSRLDELQAGILRTKLPHLNVWNKKRRDIAIAYSHLLHGVGDIEIPLTRPYALHIFHQYVIRTKKRDELLSFLQKKSIPVLIHYPIPIHKQTCYPQYNSIKLPRTEQFCREILSLPIHPYMLKSDVYTIVKAVKQFFT